MLIAAMWAGDPLARKLGARSNGCQPASHASPLGIMGAHGQRHGIKSIQDHFTKAAVSPCPEGPATRRESRYGKVILPQVWPLSRDFAHSKTRSSFREMRMESRTVHTPNNAHFEML